jgi:hypothetical protein
MAYVFGIIPLPTADDVALGGAVRDYWTRFARSGDPNRPSRPGRRPPLKWPRFDDATDLRFDLDVRPSVLPHFRRAQCEFWWGVHDAEFAGGSAGGAPVAE